MSNKMTKDFAVSISAVSCMIDDRNGGDRMADGSLPVAPEGGAEAQGELLDVPLDSAALSRLLDEVRGEDIDVSRSYNRTYNRHNR
jgi:hypothetical protein